MRQIWAWLDKEGTLDTDIRLIPESQVSFWNEKQYGIFQTVQSFKGRRRIINDLDKILHWAVDIDEGSKEVQHRCIEQSPVFPTQIVETKRGYQCYWKAYDADKESFGRIEQALVHFYKADNKAKDLARVMRYPNTYHWKDPQNPFLVRCVYQDPREIMQDVMLRAYKPAPARVYKIQSDTVTNPSDIIRGLEKLSGKPSVRGDVFTFKKHNNGTYQIWVNGKNSSSWIDANGKIGSHDRGGPFLFQWVKWYGHSNRDVMEILKKEGINVQSK